MAAKKKGGKASRNPESVIDELEHGGEAIVKQVGEQLDSVRARVSDVASTVVDTTTEVSDRVTSHEARSLISGLVDDVEKIGKYALDQVSGTVNALQRRVAGLVGDLYGTEPEKAPAATGKRSAAKATKKKAGRKKTAGKKAVRKKAVARTATAKKKTAGKKAAKKKSTKHAATRTTAAPGGRKKKPARKRASKKQP